MQQFSLNHPSFFLYPLIFPHLIMCLSFQLLRFCFDRSLRVPALPVFLHHRRLLLGHYKAPLFSYPTHHLPKGPRHQRPHIPQLPSKVLILLLSPPCFLKRARYQLHSRFHLNYPWLTVFQPLLILLTVIPHRQLQNNMLYLLKYKQSSAKKKKNH